jgi:outer membrane protein assembly factor BamA
MPRLAAIIATLFLVAVAASAETRVIRSIDIEQPSGIPDSIIRAETRLDVGKSYGEEQIRDAVYRVRRLPFVFRADYRLEPATAPDEYRLVLTIISDHRFNARFGITAERGQRFSALTLAPSLAYRTFLGNTNVLDATLGSNSVSGGGRSFGEVGLAWSGYDLFGKRINVSAGLSKDFFTVTGSRASLTPTLHITLPMTVTQSIAGDFHSASEEHDESFTYKNATVFATFKLATTTATVHWLYQTADDPFFALRGWNAEAGPGYERGNFAFPEFRAIPLVANVFLQHTRTFNVAANTERFFPILHSSAFHASLTAVVSHVRTEGATLGQPGSTTGTSHVSSATARLTYIHNFIADDGTADENARAARYRAELGFIYDNSNENLRSGRLSALGGTLGLSVRSMWGWFRINLIFVSTRRILSTP